jgi:hypothetical protein
VQYSLSHGRPSNGAAQNLPFKRKACIPVAADRPAHPRKSTLPCRQTLVGVSAAMSSGVGGGSASIFVRAVPSLSPDVMVKGRNSKPFRVSP